MPERQEEATDLRKQTPHPHPRLFFFFPFLFVIFSEWLTFALLLRVALSKSVFRWSLHASATSKMPVCQALLWALRGLGHPWERGDSKPGRVPRGSQEGLTMKVRPWDCRHASVY